MNRSLKDMIKDEKFLVGVLVVLFIGMYLYCSKSESTSLLGGNAMLRNFKYGPHVGSNSGLKLLIQCSKGSGRYADFGDKLLGTTGSDGICQGGRKNLIAISHSDSNSWVPNGTGFDIYKKGVGTTSQSGNIRFGDIVNMACEGRWVHCCWYNSSCRSHKSGESWYIGSHTPTKNRYAQYNSFGVMLKPAGTRLHQYSSGANDGDWLIVPDYTNDKINAPVPGNPVRLMDTFFLVSYTTHGDKKDGKTGNADLCCALTICADGTLGANFYYGRHIMKIHRAYMGWTKGTVSKADFDSILRNNKDKIGLKAGNVDQDTLFRFSGQY